MIINKFRKASLVFGAVFAVTNVSAASLQAVYDSQTSSVSIVADTDYSKMLASVIIMPSSVDVSAVSDSEFVSNKYIYKAVRTDENGDFSETLKIPSDYASGSYTVHFINKDNKLSSRFSFINKSELSEIISHKINPAADGAEISDIIKNEPQSFGFDAESAEQYADTLGALIYSSKPIGGYNIDLFESVYSKSNAVARIKAGDDVSAVMKIYASSFGITSEEFDGISSAAKSQFAANIVSASAHNNVDTIFKELFFTAIANTSLSYVDLKNNAYKYGTLCGADFSCLAGFSDEAVVRTFAALGMNFSSVGDFNTRLAATATAIKNGSVATVGGSGGGGGGSSAGGGIGFQTSGAAASSLPYADIAAHWAREYIVPLSAKNIINGYEDGTFRPDSNITRAEFAKLLVTLAGKAPVYKNVFDDVSQNNWCYGFVAAAADMNLINGYNGNFEPNGLITKQDAAVMLYRYAQSKGMDHNGSVGFADRDSISDYAEQAVGALERAGVISGSNGFFYPENNTTRAEAATLIYKLLSFMKEV